ncbi:MAG: mannose-1-phosphate guanylyltransferase [Cyanobacteria bacterium P01_F01_bin.42]
MFIPVILAGGKGERFWPLSRARHPKQFLNLNDNGQSLLQNTATRLLPLAGSWENIWVITAAPIADGVRQQLPQLSASSLLIEPQGKDTAPAVAWATLEVAAKYGEEAVLGFFPADHWIADPTGFEKTLKAAAELASKKAAIVTLGIQPVYPATGYGYIKQGPDAGQYGDCTAYQVDRFTEKPNESTAAEFLESGLYSWNSGMFIFRAGVMLEQLQKHSPDLLSALRSNGKAAYETLPKISIDYALMEKTDRAFILPADFHWDDLGDWNALSRLHSAQENGTVELATHRGIETHNSIIYAEDKEELVVSIGLEDTLVVRVGKVTLVAKKERSQDIKKVLKMLREDPQFNDVL